MKRFLNLLLTIALLTLPGLIELKADHLIGGEITYEYIGNTQFPNRYKINVTLHRTTRWTPFTGVMGGQLCVRSSCFPNQNVNLSVTPGTPANGQLVPNQAECVNQSNPNFTEVIEHFLEGVVDLPGVCSDYTFGYVFQCCRLGIGNITNYNNNGTGGSRNYIEAKLNNTQGNNTSPIFITPPAKTFCLNNFFSWNQGVVEPDNDSIQYDFGVAMNAPAQCSPGQNMGFQPPYSRIEPLNVAAGTSMVIQPNGIIEFTTGVVQGNYIIVIEVVELRLHPSGGFYYQVGSVMREMLINLVDNCLPSVQGGPRFDINSPLVTNEPISTSALGVIGNNYNHPNVDSFADPNSVTGYSMNLPVINYTCFDSIITLPFETYIQCPSITNNASEFRLISPDSTLVPIVGIEPNCNAALETRSIQLKLFKPMAVNGDYYLYIKQGDDGNTLLNSCGFEMPEFYLVVIRISDCTNPEYDITNVSVLNNDHNQIFWKPDTTTFPLHAITGWYFFRSDDGGNSFNRVGSLTGVNAANRNDWIDYGVNNNDVNNQSYQYKIQLNIGNSFFQLTRDVTSIYLERGNNWGNWGSQNTWMLNWNDYNGWGNPEYTLMIWDIDSGIWSAVNQVNNPTQNSNIGFDYNQISDRPGGRFALRIDAINSDSSYVAKSNYIYLDVPEVPIPNNVFIEDLSIPNIFTPNGDGENDYFTIKGIQAWRNVSVTILNRWGNVVFKDENFQVNNFWDATSNNKPVSDGVYFYKIELTGSLLGQGDLKETGPLTIIR